MVSELRPAIVSFLALTVVCGVLYPLLVTAGAQVLFPYEANGSLVRDDAGEVVGSALIGQSFDDPRYFWGRLSATSPPYNAAASSGSNYGPLNPALAEAANGRVQALRAGSEGAAMVPVDLATASASGLDPDISPEGARWQAERVARARGLDPERVLALIEKHLEPRTLGFLGEPRVKVLALNRAMDQLE